MRGPADNAACDIETGAFLIGYARVSTRDQDLSNQEVQPRAAGCGRIFAEKIMLRDNLRHASISTTSTYMHSDEVQRAR
jgi:hypothetical protein